MSEPLVVTTADGLYCPAGRFHIDPWRPVERAVITHAHGDHLRNGNAHYDYAAIGRDVVASRLAAGFAGTPHDYGASFGLGDARVSFHPAGHVLGSAQVRIEVDGETWVVSGDYKRDPDPDLRAVRSRPLRHVHHRGDLRVAGLPLARHPARRGAT